FFLPLVTDFSFFQKWETDRMSKAAEKTVEAPEEAAAPEQAAEKAPEKAPEKAAEGQAQQQQQMVQVQVNDKEAMALYANFCRVTGSPEELIIDFGLNPQPVGIPRDPIDVKQRIIVNYFTAKRLLAALQMSVQRHEAVFGVLETDIQKRVKTQR
ncbi:MAG: DUF3467 domain-containing protein, partial [Pirellulaceae bacterium]